MGHGRRVADGADFEACGRQGSDGRFATGTRAAHPNFYAAQSAFGRFVSRRQGCLLRPEWSPFTGAAEA